MDMYHRDVSTSTTSLVKNVGKGLLITNAIVNPCLDNIIESSNMICDTMKVDSQIIDNNKDANKKGLMFTI